MFYYRDQTVEQATDRVLRKEEWRVDTAALT